MYEQTWPQMVRNTTSKSKKIKKHDNIHPSTYCDSIKKKKKKKKVLSFSSRVLISMHKNLISILSSDR